MSVNTREVLGFKAVLLQLIWSWVQNLAEQDGWDFWATDLASIHSRRQAAARHAKAVGNGESRPPLVHPTPAERMGRLAGAQPRDIEIVKFEYLGN